MIYSLVFDSFLDSSPPLRGRFWKTTQKLHKDTKKPLLCHHAMGVFLVFAVLRRPQTSRRRSAPAVPPARTTRNGGIQPRKDAAARQARPRRTESSATARWKFGAGAPKKYFQVLGNIFSSTWKIISKYLEFSRLCARARLPARSRRIRSAPWPNPECAVAEAAVRRGRTERVGGPYFGRGGRQGLWGAAGCADAVSAGCACARSESGRGVSSSSFSGKAPLEL